MVRSGMMWAGHVVGWVPVPQETDLIVVFDNTRFHILWEQVRRESGYIALENAAKATGELPSVSVIFVMTAQRGTMYHSRGRGIIDERLP